MPREPRQRVARQRAAITNGSRVFLERVNSDSEHARRFKDLVEQAERERGGRAALGATEQVAVRIWAGLVVQLDAMHSVIGRGDTVDPEMLGQIGDRIDRAARRMGPVKAARPATRPQGHALGERRPHPLARKDTE